MRIVYIWGVIAFAAALTHATGFASDNVVTLGAPTSFSGKFAGNGDNMRKGYDLAVEAINAAGGVTIGDKSYRLAVQYYDDESTPARATELAERLVTENKVRFMLAPYITTLTKAVQPIVERLRVPMVISNAAARELYSAQHRYSFGVLSTSEQYLAPIVDLAAAHAAKLGKPANEIGVALVVDIDAFGEAVRQGVLERVRRHGMRLVIDDRLDSARADLSATLNRVAALEPDLLLVSGRETGAGATVKQLQSMRIHVPMVGMTHCDSARLAEVFGKAAEHVFCAEQWKQSMPHTGGVFQSAAGFARRFKQAYGYDPPYQSAQSAGAVEVLADALRRAGTLDGETVREALAATDLKTFFGPVRFDQAGRNIAKPMAISQVIGGRFVLVAPAELSAAQPLIPRPKQ